MCVHVRVRVRVCTRLQICWGVGESSKWVSDKSTAMRCQEGKLKDSKLSPGPSILFLIHNVTLA